MSAVRPRRSTAVLVAAATAALGAGLLVAVPASARGDDQPAVALRTSRSEATGVLSARLAALAAPAVAQASTADRARALALPRSGPGALIEDERGQVLITVGLAAPADAARLPGLGEVVNVSPTMSRATMRIAPSRLPQLAATPGVLRADLVPAPITGGSHLATGATAATSARSVGCRPVVSEADSHLRAGVARAIGRVDGTGVTVAVLSDSYNRDPSISTAAEDVARGELPGAKNPCGRTTPVAVVKDLVETSEITGSDEGRAMLQLVHDVAPGARLQFATAFEGEDAMASRIRSLAAGGADVIVDDVSYFVEPFFQSGVIDQAVEDVTAAGVTYFSAAGNSNVVLAGKDVSSWETPSTRIGGCPAVTSGGEAHPITDCVDFAAAGGDRRYDLTVAPGGVVVPVIQWAEPVRGLTDDFDAYLVDSATGAILAGSENSQLATPGFPIDTEAPYEYLGWENTGATPRSVAIVVSRYAGTGTPRLKLALVQSAGVTSVEYATSQGGDVVGPTVFGHNGGAATISVGAVRYDTRTAPETFSSRGPVTHYFGPVVGSSAAAPLGAPRAIPAPDLAATDGTATSFFAQQVGPTWRFFGTSAAAPHAAAVAALLLDQRPTRTPAQVLATLRATAAKVGTAPTTAVGAGLIDALRATTGITGPVARPGRVGRPKVRALKRGVKVSFARPASTGGLAIIGYRATCTPVGAGKARSSSGSRTTLTVKRLRSGTAYRCTVVARNALGTGPLSRRSAKATPRG